ncbi:hypothetical protein D9615_007760 [Tricholomella constricta]|uniref:RanBP2-type domain-containing protein n=1 Tax=Tricholomella constricta TaxID=117010 RepID=A0A8H5H3J0_9AGAR|nr:hypothetical protein D9615_007760 [Tricholomella constricta]
MMDILDQSNNLDYLQSQFRSLTISSHSPDFAASHLPKDGCTLGAPFSMSYSHQSKETDDGHTVIDTFSPKPLMYDLSPTSSASSDVDSPLRTSPRSSFEAFLATRSRVVRLYNLPRLADAYLSAVFLPQSTLRGPIPTPVSLWTMCEEYVGQRLDSVWAVFKTHEEARSFRAHAFHGIWEDAATVTTIALPLSMQPFTFIRVAFAISNEMMDATAALSLSNPALSVTTALESDLEPFHKLRRFALTTPAPTSRPSATPSQTQLRVSSSHSDLKGPRHTYDRASGMDGGDYTLSTNPPNPRTSFRLGDWISPKCAAHNFGRNLACIGCGCPRSNNGGAGAAAGGSASVQAQQQTYQQTRNVSSPRFSSFPAHSSSLPSPQTQSAIQQSSYSAYSQPQQSHMQQQHQPSTFTHSPAPAASKSAHPLLTPSGRAFAVGGKVQNISSDPLSPCIMYWPDNEPFPEQGQIRPSGLVGVPYSQQPPILNTGNRGPISHQPGDWVCLKCNYLNWRRRKVCQTCLPYAEGNGDSISAAVQAERIALLTSVLAQNQHQAAGPQAPRSHSLTPPQQRRPFIDVSPSQPQPLQLQPHAPVHRSHSHFELGAQYNNHRDPSPIYQTSGGGNRQRQPSPLYSTGPEFHSLPVHTHAHAHVHAPAPLLPSFLQDIVQSPALSPTSTSSADLSFEEYEDVAATTTTTTTKTTTFPRARTNSGDDSASDSPLGNIWRLDGEESKSLSAFALPNSQDLIGSNKRNSREGLRLQVITS